jgi:hypothetical protein
MMLRKIRDFLLYPQPYRVMFANMLRRKRHERTSSPHIYRVLFGDTPKPHYGYCLYHAAVLAKELGHSAVTVIEFGVANGAGLFAIEKHIREIRRNVDIDFHVFGFDLETGVPITEDHRDIAFKGWLGKYRMEDKAALEDRLQVSKLIIGDVSKTVPAFPDHQPADAPIGCIFFDLDLYTSTMAAFRIFDLPEASRLPRVVSYFDDIQGSNEYIGELAAIRDFNAKHDDKKIAKPYGLFAVRPHLWIEMVFQMHDFAHSDYHKPIVIPDADIF